MEMINTPSPDAAVEILAALAQSSRLAVFRELVSVGSTGLAAGAIAKRVGVPTSSLSFHLTNLKQAGLVAERREGRSIIYTVRFETMRGLMAYLLENCCAEEGSGAAIASFINEGERA